MSRRTYIKQKKDFKHYLKYFFRIMPVLVLTVLIYSCTTVPGLQEESSGTYIKIPFVRVLVEDNLKETFISADKQYAVECLDKGEQMVYYTSQPVKINIRSGKLRVTNSNGTIIKGGLDEVNIIPRGSKNRVLMNKKKYRGLVKALVNGGNLQLINVVYMEDYLRGVVPPELGIRSEDEIESVKAQAIAARTYAMAHLQQYKNKPYDMKSSIIDQVYEGFNVEDKIVNRAIDATAGEVLFYDDEFVNAYYHSTCGGMTDDIEKVWERKESPYLKAVKDNDACSWSKYFNWNESFTEKQLRGRINQYLSADRGRNIRIGKIKDIVIKDFTPGGRINNLFIVTDKDRYRFKKDRIRWVIGRTSNPDLILPSDNFDVIISRDGKGYVNKVTFKGRGYGHGVGMCQCGAIGLSRNGETYDNILKLYYSGVDIKKLY